uniref:DUF4817 domain-containing protein n=1 Tax=Gongylonema pulchrum TaxID=637853 RepID=A0A183E9V1_9BILA
LRGREEAVAPGIQYLLHRRWWMFLEYRCHHQAALAAFKADFYRHHHRKAKIHKLSSLVCRQKHPANVERTSRGDFMFFA